MRRGFTDIFKVSIDEELCNLQKLIYLNTKNYLVKHKDSLTLEEKVNLNFKEIPSEKEWSYLMETVNNSDELKNLINSEIGMIMVWKN